MATQNYFKAKNGLEAPSQSTIAVTDSNFPTVRPTLNLDFAGSESVDSRITFTRASAATYFGADGKLKYAVQNEPRIEYDPITGECKGLLIEEQRTNLNTSNLNYNAYYTIATQNAAIAPDGTLTAIKFAASSAGSSGHRYEIPHAVTAATTYTHSVYVKAAGVNYVHFFTFTDNSGYSSTGAGFNLSSGTTTTVQAGCVATITPVGNGWYRISATVTSNLATSAAYIAWGLGDIGAGQAFSGNNIDGAYIWGYQREVGAFPTSYIPSTTTFTSRASSATYFDSTGTLRIAGTNQARYGYGYDSTSGKWVSQGLILENAATNLLLYSAIQSSQWSIGSGSVTYNSAVAPDGTNTALTYTCSADVDHIYKGLDYAPLAGTNTRIVFSVWVKGTAGQTIRTRILTSGGTSADAETYTTLNGQWQRVEVSGITGTTYTYIYPYDRRTGVGTATNIQIWGGQVETGYVATSYIPTYGAAATRAADVSSSAATTRSADSGIMNIEKVTNQLEGTYFGETQWISVPGVGNQRLLFASSDDDLYAIEILRTSGGDGVTGSRRGIGTIASYPSSTSGFVKYAFGWNYSQEALAANGNITTSGTATASNRYFNNIRFGYMPDGTAYNGYIKRIVYYPKRISNTQLQALTA